VSFGELGNLTKNLANGKMSVELTNKNITFIKDMPGLKPALPESKCRRRRCGARARA